MIIKNLGSSAFNARWQWSQRSVLCQLWFCSVWCSKTAGIIEITSQLMVGRTMLKQGQKTDEKGELVAQKWEYCSAGVFQHPAGFTSSLSLCTRWICPDCYWSAVEGTSSQTVFVWDSFPHIEDETDVFGCLWGQVHRIVNVLVTFTLKIPEMLWKILPQVLFIKSMEGHSDGSSEQSLLQTGRGLYSSGKHYDMRPACVYRKLLSHEHSAGLAFPKYLYCSILIRNIYLSLEEAEACPGLLCFGCKGCLQNQPRNSGSSS